MKYIKHKKECFIRYPNNEKWVEKNEAQPSFIIPTSTCLDICWNTSSDFLCFLSLIIYELEMLLECTFPVLHEKSKMQ